jgi:hypothetical protein
MAATMTSLMAGSLDHLIVPFSVSSVGDDVQMCRAVVRLVVGNVLSPMSQVAG